MFLKSQRILLRSLRRSDAKAVFMAIDSSRAELDKFMIWSPVTRTVQDSIDFIHRTFSDRRQKRAIGFGIFDADTKAYIGGIGLHDLRNSIQSAEIGYWIRSDRAGQGLATEHFEPPTQQDEKVRIASIDANESVTVRLISAGKPLPQSLTVNSAMPSAWLVRTVICACSLPSCASSALRSRL